ncbi:MAG: element excision factor XisI family protein [Bacteroidota bacterium]
MDKVNQLHQVILRLLEEYTASHSQDDDCSPYHLVVDEGAKRYVLFEMGFHQRSFYHITLFHLTIQDDKIWIFEDKSEDRLTELLLDKGVSSGEIVLGYFSEAYRAFTDFAMA